MERRGLRLRRVGGAPGRGRWATDASGAGVWGRILTPGQRLESGVCFTLPNMSVVFEFSAGGVVTDDAGDLVVVRVTNFAGDPKVALPKGIVERGERSLSAAQREVEEETGFQVEVISERPASVVEYWFVRPDDRVRVKKKVSFFRFRVVGGNPEDHDEEVEEVLVLPVDEALAMLSYPSEVKAVREALGR